MQAFDVVVIGGAVTGSATAFWLTRMRPGLRVLVLEPDPAYARAATALSVASIRQQFSTAVNIRISQFGLDFLRNISTWAGPAAEVHDLGLREPGYLFLCGTAEQEENMRLNNSLQRNLGAEIDLLEVSEVARLWPWLDCGDVRLGSHGRRGEGWFDNMGLLWALRRAARAAGAEYRAVAAAGLDHRGGQVQAVSLADGSSVAAGAVVIAAGTRSTDIVAMAGVKIPVEPRKRTVFFIDAPHAPKPGAGTPPPLLVDHTGFYLRPEGHRWICATVPDADGPAEPDDFEPDHAQFEDLLWPRLHARAPCFDAVKVLRMWAGHYDFNRIDANALVGRVPGFGNLHLAAGFSGHGLQQAPAVGRGLAELILEGRFVSLDLSDLAPERLWQGRLLLEKGVV